MRQSFVTTTRGLRRSSPAMRLYEKAKQFGIWNPSHIDFSQDILDWQKLTVPEKDILLRLTVLFQAGEEAVTLDILPLIMVIAQEGRLEEEMFLTTFLFEEAKHTDFFRRFIDEVAQTKGDLSHYHSSHYHMIFSEALPSALQALLTDSSPQAQARASVTYNMIVEGILAETGYHAYETVLSQHNILPGQRDGIRLLKQDESRHIAYGVYLLSRLMADNEGLWDFVEKTMNMLILPALGVIDDVFTNYDPIPFDLSPEMFTTYAMSQYQKRYERIQKARGASLDEIERVTQYVIETEDA
jgi:ribonucleoside-diphosphate reductase beta chain